MRLNLIKFGSVKSTKDTAIKIIRSKKSNAGIIISKNQIIISWVSKTASGPAAQRPPLGGINISFYSNSWPL